MAESTPSIQSGVFHRPFAEQVAFFRQKLGNLVPTRFWDDLVKAEHDRGFMVAGAMKADLLQDLGTAMERSISEGTGIESFRKDFRAAVARHGWTGWTGEATKAGRAWRTRVIYTTNAQTSYSAGRYAQLREGKFTLWVYHHTHGEMNPRPIHVSWDGLTLPPDHPFWRTNYPPNGWGCKCYVVGARSEADARRLDGDPNKKLPAGWDQIDAKTGEPNGIDKGWGYAPGASVQRTVREMAAKTQQWDYTLAKAYMQNVPADVRDDLAISYRNLPSVRNDTRRYAQRILAGRTNLDIPPYRTLGLVTSSDASTIGNKLGADVSNYDFAVGRSEIKHIQSSHGTAATEIPRGQQPITTDDYALLPRLLNGEHAITDAGKTDLGRSVVRISGAADGRQVTAAFEVRTGRKMLALQSLWVRNPDAPPR